MNLFVRPFPSTIIFSILILSSIALTATVPKQNKTWITAIKFLTNSVQQAMPNSTGIQINMRSGPLTSIFKISLFSDRSSPCMEQGTKTCQVAHNSFGIFGKVWYNFIDSVKNRQGTSTQVMIACRCLTEQCDLAILARPVTVMKLDQRGNEVPSGRNIIIYETIGGKFSDCHSEAFRLSNQTPQHETTTNSDAKLTQYGVHDPSTGDYWNATGVRGTWTECFENDIKRFKTVNLSEITKNDIAVSPQLTTPFPTSCIPSKNIQYYKEDNDRNDISMAMYTKALPDAIYIAFQQNCYAAAKRLQAYVNPPQELLVSDTELALTSSSAILGIFLLLSVLRHQGKKNHRLTVKTIVMILLQVVISYTLEALPMHTALANEIRATNWRSPLAFVDMIYSYMMKDGKRNGMLLMIIVVGDVHYFKTRLSLVAALTILFDIIAVIIGILIFLRLVIFHKYKKTDENSEKFEIEFCHSDSSETDGKFRKEFYSWFSRRKVGKNILRWSQNSRSKRSPYSVSNCSKSNIDK